MQMAQRTQQISAQIEQNSEQLKNETTQRARYRNRSQSQQVIPLNYSNQQSKINGLEALNIETSEGDIPNPQMIRSSQDLDKLDMVQTQNIQLKRRNNRLKKELQKINEKLECQLARKNNQQQQKAEFIINFELRNAYKRCQIMKKELRSLKKKDVSLVDQKHNSLQYALTQKSRENEQLRNEIKSLKNIKKFQQKGLIQLGSKQYVSQAAQIQRLKGENKKLYSKVQQLQRAIRMHQISTKNERKFKQSLLKQDSLQRQQLKSRIQKDVKVLRDVQERDSHKVKHLTFQKNRQHQIIQNLKMQLGERDNQIQHLKDIISNIRRVYKTKKHVNFDNRRLNTQSGHQSVTPSRQHSSSNLQKDQQNQEEVSGYTKNLSSLMVKYPRMQEKGQRADMGLNWNHHSFSSKIKEIQILPHHDGHIKAIHVRYQKGEPSKIKGQYSSFVCEQFKEYVKNISGGFKDGLLQFLIISTNQKRVNKFCRYDIEDQCTKFSFNIQDTQYPCALFGQNVQDGIVRFGCFIQKLNGNQKQHH